MLIYADLTFDFLFLILRLIVFPKEGRCYMIYVCYSLFDFETDCFPKGREMLHDLCMLMCAEMSLLEM